MGFGQASRLFPVWLLVFPALFWGGAALPLHVEENPAARPQAEKGTFGYDQEFLDENDIRTIVLTDPSTDARVLLAPGYQGRVMTSTAKGVTGRSFGWINYMLISSGRTEEHINAYGGEERLWLGPEGGKFSLFFADPARQEYANWFVPPPLDTEAFDIINSDDRSVTFGRQFRLKTASGTALEIGIRRKVTLLRPNEVERYLGVTPDSSLRIVAYQSDNLLTNRGREAWTKETGMPSVWMLSMLNASPDIVVAIPYKEGDDKKLGPIVTDTYFGKVPQDRLTVEKGLILFKADGKYRSKVGLSPRRAREYAAGYDRKNNILTLLWFSLPYGKTEYVNSTWGPQAEPFAGDAINAYNDGPLADGTQLGSFYELESSSTAANLKPGETLWHSQRIYHFEGNPERLSEITRVTLGVNVARITASFR